MQLNRHWTCRTVCTTAVLPYRSALHYCLLWPTRYELVVKRYFVLEGEGTVSYHPRPNP